MKSSDKNIWVIILTDSQGRAEEAGLQLLNPGASLAKQCGGRLWAVVIGTDTAQGALEAAELGADVTLTVETPELNAWDTGRITGILYYLTEKYRPFAMLIPADSAGRAYAPKLAARLDSGLTADCTGLCYNKVSGLVEWTRPALGGNILATIVCRGNAPQMATIRPGVFKKPEKLPNKAEIIEEKCDCSGECAVELLETLRESAQEQVSFDNAEIIVAGGRGLGDSRGFELIDALASCLGGRTGASRAAVDLGWISHSHQIGQTGNTVAPKLYIACGISGAVQHLAGIAGAEHILAINTDSEAPIFKIADYGIVGDLYEVIPGIIKEIQAKRYNKND